MSDGHDEGTRRPRGRPDGTVAGHGSTAGTGTGTGAPPGTGDGPGAGATSGLGGLAGRPGLNGLPALTGLAGGLSGRLAPLRDRLRRRGSGAKTAFVLSGGGNLGALQVGMLRALLEHRILPDLVLGCSVGALNGAGVAADPSLAMVGRLQELWLDLEGRDVLPAGLLPTTVQLARRGVSVHGNAGLRQVIQDVLPDDATFEDLVVPFQCVATDIAAAREVWFSSGSIVEPVLASAALPAMLPPVEIDGVRYIDGAVVNDVPVTRAVELGATTIYVLHVGGFDRPRPEPKRPFDMALQAYWIARRARFRRDMAALPDTVEAVLMPTGDAPAGRFNDFSHSAALMSSAYQASDALLRERARPADEPSDEELSISRAE